MGEVRRGSNLFPFPNRQDGTFRCCSWEGKEKKKRQQAEARGAERGAQGAWGGQGDSGPVLQQSPPVEINLSKQQGGGAGRTRQQGNRRGCGGRLDRQ